MPNSCQRLAGAIPVTLTCLAVSAAAPAVASAHARRCAHANTPAAGASRAEIKRAVVCLIDQQRRRHGLPPLREDSRLDRSAQGWTNTMVRTDQFDHGANFAARITAVGFVWSAAGENIATGFATPRQVVDAWMGSAGHCRNILDPSFSRVGTGVVTRPFGHYRGATWTQDFGLPRGARAPSGNTGPMNGCPY